MNNRVAKFVLCLHSLLGWVAERPDERFNLTESLFGRLIERDNIGAWELDEATSVKRSRAMPIASR